jgi:ATP-dependent DNA helicase RecG
MEMAEERGFGLKSLKNRAEKLGLPLPKYAWEDPYLVLTLFRHPEAAARTLKPSVLQSLTDSERKGWQWLSLRGKTKSRQYAKALQVEDRTARRHLNRFLELGLVRKTGTGPSTQYELK